MGTKPVHFDFSANPNAANGVGLRKRCQTGVAMAKHGYALG